MDDYDYAAYTDYLADQRHEAAHDAAVDAAYNREREEFDGFLDYAGTTPEGNADLAWAVYADYALGTGDFDEALRKADEVALAAALGLNVEEHARRVMDIPEGNSISDAVIDGAIEGYSDSADRLRAVFDTAELDAMHDELVQGMKLAAPGAEDEDTSARAVMDWMARYGEPVPAPIVESLGESSVLDPAHQWALLDRMGSLTPSSEAGATLLSTPELRDQMTPEQAAATVRRYERQLDAGLPHRSAVTAAFAFPSGSAVSAQVGSTIIQDARDTVAAAHPAGPGAIYQSPGGTFWRVEDDGTLSRRSFGGSGWASTKNKTPIPDGAEPVTRRKAAQMAQQSGTCLACSRPLSDPASQARGYGPDCAGRFV